MFLLQQLQLSRLQAGFIKLGELESEIIEIGTAFGSLFLQLSQPPRCLIVFRKEILVSLQSLTGTGDSIDNPELKLPRTQFEILVLGVDVYQTQGEIAEQGKGDRRIVYESSIFLRK